MDEKLKTDKFRARLRLMLGLFAAAFVVVGVRLVDFALAPGDISRAAAAPERTDTGVRPEITDRNGTVLATDIETASLYADTRKLVDIDEAVEKLFPILEDVPRADLRRRLSTKRAFIWLKREISPRQRAAIHELGIAGLGFRAETRRVYPAGLAAAHVLGHVNIDNQGIAGIEKYIDRSGDADRKARANSEDRDRDDVLKPVMLSLDLKVQHALRDELAMAIKRFRAIAAAGVVMDVATGEIPALVSLPDYTPNDPRQALEKKRLNRITAGVYELGSIFKVITTAMALDYGAATLESRFDARMPLKIGTFTINDFHAQRRILTVPEIFTHSSNIGSARMAMAVGIDRHKAFLERLGLLSRLETELPEGAHPLSPRRWKQLNSMTIAFGHGVSVTPLQFVAAAAALVNGGRYIPPSLLVRDRVAALAVSRRVVKRATSDKIRALMALNVEKGTARKAAAPGYRVGGKTGTAEKVVNGRYAKNRLLTSFLGTFPAEAPRYVVLVMLDEPKGSAETHNHATSGWNAAPVAGRLISRIAPMLGVLPRPVQAAAAETARAQPADAR